jgi:predicted amidohydrolase
MSSAPVRLFTGRAGRPSWKDAAMTVRIATSQPAGTIDAHHNGDTVRTLMRQTAAAGAELIQFPEGFLSGYAKEQIAD